MFTCFWYLGVECSKLLAVSCISFTSFFIFKIKTKIMIMLFNYFVFMLERLTVFYSSGINIR